MTTIEYFKQAIEKPLEDVDGKPLSTFLCAGFVNPFHPILSAVVAVGELIPPCSLPVVQLALTPFAANATEIGRCRFDENWPLPSELWRLLAIACGECPSFFLPGAMFDEQDAIEIHARWVAHLRGARKTWDMIKKFPGDPSARVNAGTMRAAERWIAIERGQRSERDPDGGHDERPLDEIEARKFATYVLSTDHMGPELLALSAAWTSAIKLRDDGPRSRPAVLLDADAYLKWLHAIGGTCRFAG